MGIRDMNKAFKLPLPTSVKFVLLALARYTSNETGTCYPGINKMADMTGYCEKTVIRSLRVLSRLGIIDVHQNPKGLNNIYTLYITGDIEAWDEYLKSKSDEIKLLVKENQAASISSKSIYIDNFNNKNKELVTKEDLAACDKSHAIPPTSTTKKSVEGDILKIPPGKRKTEIQKIWEETVPVYFKGLEVRIYSEDLWAIENICNSYSDKLPLFDFIEFMIANWTVFSKAIRNAADVLGHPAKIFPVTPRSLSGLRFRTELVLPVN